MTYLYEKIQNHQNLERSPEVHQKIMDGDFPGGPVAKTPCSQCRGPGFDPWSGN